MIKKIRQKFLLSNKHGSLKIWLIFVVFFFSLLLIYIVSNLFLFFPSPISSSRNVPDNKALEEKLREIDSNKTQEEIVDATKTSQPSQSSKPAQIIQAKPSESNKQEAEEKTERKNIRILGYRTANYEGTISFPLDQNYYDTIHMIKNEDLSCNGGKCIIESDRQKLFIDYPGQKEKILVLANQVRNIVQDKDEQARVTASLVQYIPYDFNKFTKDETPKFHNSRFIYEVLYENQGVCVEKARLLASLLGELGFETVLFELMSDGQGHTAVGIKCSEEFDYQDTGYCYIESTNPSLITDYSQFGTSPSQLDVVPISKGISFNAKIDFEKTQSK